MPTEHPPYVQVAFPLDFPEPLTYALPADLAATAEIGSPVLAPLARRLAGGWIVGFSATPPRADLKILPIRELLETEPLWGADHLALFQWVADYYFHPLGRVIDTAVPAGTTAGSRKMIRLTPAGRDALHVGGLSPVKVQLLRDIDTAHQVRPDRLKQVTGHGTSSAAVKALLADGLLEQTQVMRKPRVQTVKRKTYSIVDPTPPDLPPRAAKEEEAYVYLREHGPCAAGDFPPEIKSAAAALTRLEKKGHIRSEYREILRDPFAGELPPRTDPLPLIPAQQAVFDAVLQKLDPPHNETVLLHGITGSGKTEVYLQLIARVLEHGRTALVLVPEIALTPQLVNRFRARFGDTVAVLHSGLGPGERYDQWKRIRRGDARIAIGVRSAVFAPLSNLGLIVVDEEHDGSYKQEEGLAYNARDVAIVRAKLAGVPIVMGSATPRMESYYRARRGDYRLLELPERATRVPLPEVELIDPGKESGGSAFFNESGLTRRLQHAIAETLSAGEQTLLFLNRRGFNPVVRCEECGFSFCCPHCDVGLTFHHRSARIVCHSCGYEANKPAGCPECANKQVGYFGLGTEQLETAIQTRFPEARVARFDRDTVRGKAGHQKILDAFAAHEIDIMVGTQMITKGHDFPAVTLVGVILADASLHFPDFRAAERTFGLLTQVAGRAGRAERPGRVIFQTFLPEHPAIQAARYHNYPAFYDGEIARRERLYEPPFCRLAILRLEGPEEGRLIASADRLAARLLPPAREHGVTLQGPAPALTPRVKDRWRYQLRLKAPNRPALERVLRTIHPLPKGLLPGNVTLRLDIDPMSMI